MGDKIPKIMIFSLLFVAGLVVYMWFLGIFLMENFWWILPFFVCAMLLIGYDHQLKKEELEKMLRLKDRREIRIDFY